MNFYRSSSLFIWSTLPTLWCRLLIIIITTVAKSISTPQTDLFRFFTAPSTNNCMRHLCEQELQQFLLLFQKIKQHRHSSAYGDDLLANTELIQLLVMINLIFEKKEMHIENYMPDVIRDTMDYIEAHLTEPISLQNLSQALFHNGVYLSRKFKEHTGISLRDYANFTRTFTKHTGYSPGKYQKHLLY